MTLRPTAIRASLVVLLGWLSACAAPPAPPRAAKSPDGADVSSSPPPAPSAPTPRSPEPATRTLAKLGERCAGFGVIRCEQGLVCNAPADVLDGAGVCERAKP